MEKPNENISNGTLQAEQRYDIYILVRECINCSLFTFSKKKLIQQYNEIQNSSSLLL